MKGLTEKQQNIIRFIGEFTAQEHMAPTVYELADHFHIKTSTIFAHLKALQQKGMLTRTSQARSIKLPAPPSRSAALPDIVALPLEDPSGGIGEWLVDRHLFDADHREEGFALKISDDALRDFGIFPGDIVIVHKIETLTAGQRIVVNTFAGKPSYSRIAMGREDPIIGPRQRLQPWDVLIFPTSRSTAARPACRRYTTRRARLRRP